MAGLAMATIVPSRATIMTPMATAKRVSQGWPRSPFGGSGAGSVRRSGGDAGSESSYDEANVSH